MLWTWNMSPGNSLSLACWSQCFEHWPHRCSEDHGFQFVRDTDFCLFPMLMKVNNNLYLPWADTVKRLRKCTRNVQNCITTDRLIQSFDFVLHDQYYHKTEFQLFTACVLRYLSIDWAQPSNNTLTALSKSFDIPMLNSTSSRLMASFSQTFFRHSTKHWKENNNIKVTQVYLYQRFTFFYKMINCWKRK